MVTELLSCGLHLMMYQTILKKDRTMKHLIKQHGAMVLSKKKNAYLHLCLSILSQQLSTKVAKVIKDRFLALYEGKFPTPQQIIDTPVSTLRGIGFSNAKASYIHNVALFAMEQGMEDKKLGKMSDEEVIDYLVPIKGVGRWTVEMLLIFTLGREDVFAVDDLGIQNAMVNLYGLDKTDKKKMKAEMIAIAEKWRPFRSYACLYLWRSLDNQ
jgi:DNA-3-methyladenine glycosylase II